jgi:hypothetical protein
MELWQTDWVMQAWHWEVPLRVPPNLLLLGRVSLPVAFPFGLNSQEK